MVKGYERQSCGRRGVSLTIAGLGPLHKTIHHLLLAGLFERDRELVAVDLDHMAVAEFLVEDAVVQREFRDRAGRFRDQLALDRYGSALLARSDE